MKIPIDRDKLLEAIDRLRKAGIPCGRAYDDAGWSVLLLGDAPDKAARCAYCPRPTRWLVPQRGGTPSSGRS